MKNKQEIQKIQEIIDRMINIIKEKKPIVICYYSDGEQDKYTSIIEDVFYYSAKPEETFDLLLGGIALFIKTRYRKEAQLDLAEFFCDSLLDILEKGV